MRNRLLILLASLLLVGCSAKQTFTAQTELETSQHTATDLLIQQHDTIAERLRTDLTHRILEQLNVKIIEEIYDTDKPVNPETGEYPVKSRKTTDIAKQKDETQQAHTEVEKQEANNLTMQDKSTKDEEMKLEVSEKIDVKDPYRIRYIFYIIITVAAIALAVFLSIKKINPLSWIKKLFCSVI